MTERTGAGAGPLLGSARDEDAGQGALAPLKHRLFAIVFLVNLFTSLAVFINGLSGAWVLTGLTESPAVVASLQLAVTIPSFLLALLAGALADVVSRKRLIVVAQTGSILVAGSFALLSAAGAHRPATVLGLTAALGVLGALSAPAWMSVIPGLVPRRSLAGAMTLSSVGMSGAMAIGPAIAGLLIAAAGPTWAFTLNVVILGAGLLALRTWKPPARVGLPPEHIVAAMRLGLRFARHSKPLKIVIGKITPFALTAGAIIALFPAFARFRLEAGPAAFGLLSGASGLGAVAAFLLMPRVRRRVGPDRVVFVAMVVEAALLIVVGRTTSIPVALGVMFIVGGASLANVSTVMTVLQIVLPAWIRGRGIAVYLLVLQGAFTVSAFAWGAVAEAVGVGSALVIAGVAMAVGAVLLLPLRLGALVSIDAAAVQIIADPPPVTSVHDDDGPILLTARWQIDPARRDDLIEAMVPVRRALLGKGALGFQLAEDVERPGTMVESFTVATWSEYQRLPTRATVADREVQQRLRDAVGGDLPGFTAHRVLDLRRARTR